MKVPQYGKFRYGKLHKYGRYALSTSDGMALGPHVRYRIKQQMKSGDLSEFVTMIREQLEIHTGSDTPLRIRANDGEWVRTASEEIKDNAYKVRIRSVNALHEPSPWVYGERADLKEI
jgi:hypothetical protein